MLLSVRYDPRQCKRWHIELVKRLSRLPDMTVAAEPVLGPRPDAGAERLLRLEEQVRRRSRAGLGATVLIEDIDIGRPGASPEATLALDIAGSDAVGTARLWRLFIDGHPGEAALLPAIMRGHAPLVEIREGTTIVAAGRAGTESKGLLLETFDDALARITTLILAALSGAAPGLADADQRAASKGGNLTPGETARAALGILSRRAAGRLYRMIYQTPHWRVGWRKLDGPDLFDLRRHPNTGWRDLPDDRLRFYADPFPIVVGSTLTLFVEEYPHATGKGIISAVSFGPDGPLGSPEPVLELPYHLSYPFVFEREGEIWMVPESCAANAIDLYRATRFPGGWVKEATLVADTEASDATLHEADGRWWLFATVKDGGSYSDALHLWSAPDFRGPWTPHPRNPVLVDIASARPAGRLVTRDGVLLRPVQDCRNGYGAALGLAQVLQLDDVGFEQRVETVVTAGPLWSGHCLHTLNQAGGFEFIDGSGRARKPWRRAAS